MSDSRNGTLHPDILGFRTRITGPDRVCRDLARFFGPGASREGSNDAVRFEIRAGDPDRGWHRIHRDGRAVWSTPDEREVAPVTAWAVHNAAVAALAQRYLLLHAGAVAKNGCGLILPASSGSGKSTLTAALLTAGFRYLSDEVAAIGLGDGLLHPFPGHPAVKEGSIAPLASFCGAVRYAPERRLFGEAIRWLDVPDSCCAVEPVRAEHIVFPAYVPGAETMLEAVRRGEALNFLAAQAFNAGVHTPPGMGALIRLLGGAECFKLTFGSLEKAVKLLTELIEREKVQQAYA